MLKFRLRDALRPLGFRVQMGPMRSSFRRSESAKAANRAAKVAMRNPNVGGGAAAGFTYPRPFGYPPP